MFCQKCGKEIPDGSEFCPKCGVGLTGSAAPEAKKSPRWILYLALVALIFVAGAYWAVRSNSDRETSTQAQVPQPRSVSIVNSAITVDAGSYVSYNFQVPANARSVVLNGHFTATGGSGNDIEAFLLNEDEFVNLKNGHDARTLYNSGKVTQATIAASLPDTPTTYYLVFDNRFSVLTPKAVTVNATLDYMQ